jgi:oligopeptide transport system substrate-binding protein
MARFDYIGFGPELQAQPGLREALVESVDFPTFLRLFDTKTPPGCPSLPARYEDKVVCQKADFTRARKLSKEAGVHKLQYHFSRMGGDDIARAAEWFQGQWRRNAGVNIELMPQEQGVYLRALKQSPPAIFRKGVSLDRPTCLAALEIFFKGNSENYLRFDDPEFERLARLAGAAKTAEESQRACRQAVERLLDSHRLIPLGEMYFTILADAKFRGWDLNELNQLDLGELEAVP